MYYLKFLLFRLCEKRNWWKKISGNKLIVYSEDKNYFLISKFLKEFLESKIISKNTVLTREYEDGQKNNEELDFSIEDFVSI